MLPRFCGWCAASERHSGMAADTHGSDDAGERAGSSRSGRSLHSREEGREGSWSGKSNASAGSGGARGGSGGGGRLSRRASDSGGRDLDPLDPITHRRCVCDAQSRHDIRQLRVHDTDESLKVRCPDCHGYTPRHSLHPEELLAGVSAAANANTPVPTGGTAGATSSVSSATFAVPRSVATSLGTATIAVNWGPDPAAANPARPTRATSAITAYGAATQATQVARAAAKAAE